MSLFFFISAYFVPASYDKKGASKYFTDRLMRLGIPLLVYIFILHPVITYGIQVYTKAYTGSFSDFLLQLLPNTCLLHTCGLFFLF
ncbi:MAG: acyltransferase family protein [Bacteroidales bacterium]|nr:acyltransferase family protein [Bacteroidales bacterium]